MKPNRKPSERAREHAAKTKPFILNGVDYAETVRLGSHDGPLVIDIDMETFSVQDARRLIRWLEAAILEVQADKRARARAEKKGRKG